MTEPPRGFLVLSVGVLGGKVSSDSDVFIGLFRPHAVVDV